MSYKIANEKDAYDNSPNQLSISGTKVTVSCVNSNSEFGITAGVKYQVDIYNVWDAYIDGVAVTTFKVLGTTGDIRIIELNNLSNNSSAILFKCVNLNLISIGVATIGCLNSLIKSKKQVSKNTALLDFNCNLVERTNDLEGNRLIRKEDFIGNTPNTIKINGIRLFFNKNLISCKRINSNTDTYPYETLEVTDYTQADSIITDTIDSVDISGQYGSSKSYILCLEGDVIEIKTIQLNSKIIQLYDIRCCPKNGQLFTQSVFYDPSTGMTGDITTSKSISYTVLIPKGVLLSNTDLLILVHTKPYPDSVNLTIEYDLSSGINSHSVKYSSTTSSSKRFSIPRYTTVTVTWESLNTTCLTVNLDPDVQEFVYAKTDTKSYQFLITRDTKITLYSTKSPIICQYDSPLPEVLYLADAELLTEFNLAWSGIVNKYSVKYITQLNSDGTTSVSYLPKYDFCTVPPCMTNLGQTNLSKTQHPFAVQKYRRKRERTPVGKCILPDTIKTIDSYAFCMSNYDVRLPDKLNTIHAGAFLACKNLLKIVIPSSVKTVPYLAFHSCNIGELTLSEGVETLSGSAITSCNIQTLVLPASLKLYTGAHLDGNGLELASISCNIRFSTIKNLYYSIPKTDTGDDFTLFGACNVENVILTDSVIEVPKNMCKILTPSVVVIPTSVTFINYGGLRDAGTIRYLGTLELFESITKDDNWAKKGQIIYCTNGNYEVP